MTETDAQTETEPDVTAPDVTETDPETGAAAETTPGGPVQGGASRSRKGADSKRQARAARDSDVRQSIRMTADRLLVTPSAEIGERRSRAGILIPATAAAARRLAWAEVVAVGPTARNVEPGDRVLFAPEAGFEVDLKGEEYLILRERDVHAVASTRVEGQTGLYL